MYRDVLYHIFEGYSLFINEYDFEECACINNSESDELSNISIYYIAIFARENDIKTVIISRFRWQTNTPENKSIFEHRFS